MKFMLYFFTALLGFIALAGREYAAAGIILPISLIGCYAALREMTKRTNDILKSNKK